MSSYGCHGAARVGHVDALPYRVTGCDLSIVTSCAYYDPFSPTPAIKVCKRCLTTIQEKLPANLVRARLSLLQCFEILHHLEEVPLEQLAEVATTLFPFYVMPETSGAEAIADELAEKINKKLDEPNQTNYLRMMALETTKYQVLCKIGIDDWLSLSSTERVFSEKVYVWGKLRLPWTYYHQLFTSIINNWIANIPLWGNIDYKELMKAFDSMDKAADHIQRRVVVGAVVQWIVEICNQNRVIAILVSFDRKQAITALCSGFVINELPLDNHLVDTKRTRYGTYRLKCKPSAWTKIGSKAKSNKLRETGRELKRITDLFHISCQVDYKYTTIFPGQAIMASLVAIRELGNPCDQDSLIEEALVYARDCLNQHTVGWSAQNFTAYYIGNMDNPLKSKRAMYERALHMRHLPFEVYNSLSKEVSTLVRAYHILPDKIPLSADERAASIGFELGTGRFVHHSDVDNEVKNRCNGAMHLTLRHLADGNIAMPNEEEWGDPRFDPQFYAEFWEVVQPVMAKLLDRRQARQSLLTFLRRRHEWVSSGSATNSAVVIEGEEVRGNKRTWAESWDAKVMEATLKNKRPREDANGSEKHENDKARALYAPDAENFCSNSYTIAGVEGRLQLLPGVEKGLSGMELVACEVRRCVYTMLPRVWLTCADYKDFNRQHTNRAMELLFRALARAADNAHAHPDYIYMCDWTADCQHNRYFNFVGMACKDTTLKRADQGMFSGTRATDILNTVNNLSYKLVAERQVKRLYGLEAQHEYAIHQGDDVWLANKSLTYAVALIAALQRMGLSMQPTKQLFTCNNGEFLRVQYAQGGSRGLMFRALINVILRPLQSTRTFDPESNIKAYCSSISTLQRRGLSTRAAQTLWIHLVTKSRVLYTEQGTGLRFLVPYSVIVMPALLGGYECAPPGSIYAGDLCSVAPPKASRTPESLEGSAAPCHMSQDWVDWLSNQVQQRINAQRLVQTAKEGNYASVLDKINVTTRKRRLIHDWQAMLNSRPELKTDRLLDIVHVEGLYLPDFRSVQRTIGRQLYVTDAIQLQLIDGFNVQAWMAKFKVALEHKIKTGEWVWSEISLLKDIHVAIGSTTFKSIDNTSIAFGGNDEEAFAYILLCLREAGRGSTRAYSMLETMKPSFVIKLLETRCGLSQCGITKLSTIFHPNVLGIAADTAIDHVVRWARATDYDGTDDLQFAALRISHNILEEFQRLAETDWIFRAIVEIQY